MLRLPHINPAASPQYQEELLQMGGINYSEQTRPGDMADSSGISARRWPYITTRQARDRLQPPGGTTAVYAWDGHWVRVTDGILYYDDKALDNVTPGPKQFVVVNTKLIIWPDKKYIDLTKGKFGSLEASISSKGGAEGVEITGDRITLPRNPVIEDGLTSVVFGSSAVDTNPCIYTYGTDPEAVKACWDGQKWTGLEQLEQLTGIFSADGVDVWMEQTPGRIFIPEKSGNSFSYLWDFAPKTPDKSAYNQEGYYGVFTEVTARDGSEPYYGTYGSDVMWHFDIFQVGVSNPLLSGIFGAGDAITVTGTPDGINDVEDRVVVSVDDETNSLYFAPKTFPAPQAYTKAVEDYPAGEPVKLRYSPSGGAVLNLKFTPTDPVRKGQYILLAQDKSVDIWDPTKKRVEVSYPTSEASGGAPLVLAAYVLSGSITARRRVPDMDYICEAENRLWGCSSKDRTIYASALGEPQRFFQYAGLSTDSYAVAVGSEGPFTGCIQLGTEVLFWKERCLHRVLGSYPPYDVYTSSVDGVQDGSSKSQQILNGTLLYLGTHGVYAYSGGSPVLISSNFGERKFSTGVSGNDGDSYYLSVREGDAKHMFVYELKERIWVREDSIYALDFARAERDLRVLEDDGSVWALNTGRDDPDLRWFFQLVPSYAPLSGRKTPTMMVVRLELPRKSHLTVELRRDGGRWEEITNVVGGSNDVVSFRLPMGRVDKTEVRLSGRGPCTVLGILRQLSIKTTRGGKTWQSSPNA